MNDDDILLFPLSDSGELSDSEKAKNSIVEIGPSDTTTRPSRPDMVKRAKDASEKIAKWKAWLNEQKKSR